MMWQLSFPMDEAEAKALSGKQSLLKAEALRRCGGWHAPILDLLAATNEAVITGYPVYDRAVPSPEDFAGNALSCVTMIGDA
jgi:salicylate hydroxylase